MTIQASDAALLGASRTSFKLVDLTNRGLDIQVQAGKPAAFGPGLTLHSADDGREALLEASPGTRVYVNGAPVMDVAHVRVGSLIEAGSDRFVFLAPFQIYVNRNWVNDGSMLLRVVADAAAVPAAGDLRIAPTAVATTPQRGRGKSVRLAVLAAGAAAMVALAFGTYSPWGIRHAPSQVAEKTVSVVVPAPVAVVVPTPAPVPPAVPTPAPLLPQTLVQKGAAPPDSPKARRSAPAPKPRDEEGPSSSPDVAEASLSKQRELYREYVLEARFDPEGIHNKLTALLASLPANSALARDVAKLLKRLK